MVVGYFLKADIKQYFDEVDHAVLMAVIKKKIADQRILLLIEKILKNHKSKTARNGMPKGNLTNQFFANVYLNELDYFVKHKLRAKYYIRYVDDFVILHRNKEILGTWKAQINESLKTLKLELHEEKSKVYPLHKGAKLVGFRIFYQYKLPYKRNLRKFHKRFYTLLDAYGNSEITPEDIQKSVDGWLAYATWANTYKLRRRIIHALNGLRGEKKSPVV